MTSGTARNPTMSCLILWDYTIKINPYLLRRYKEIFRLYTQSTPHSLYRSPYGVRSFYKTLDNNLYINI